MSRKTKQRLYPIRELPSMTAGGALTVIFTLLTLTVMSGMEAPEVYHWGKTFGFIIVYCLAALAATEKRIIGEVMAHILHINAEPSFMTDTEKVMLIKNQLGIYTELFCKAFFEVSKFKGRAKSKIWFQMKSIVRGIAKGKISPIQGIWLFFYSCYLILIQTNYFDIPLPVNIIVVFGFNLGLQFTNRSMKGVGKLVKDLFKLANSDINDSNDKFTLANIVHTIRMLCLNYYRIARQIEDCSGQTVIEFITTQDGKQSENIQKPNIECH